MALSQNESPKRQREELTLDDLLEEASGEVT